MQKEEMEQQEEGSGKFNSYATARVVGFSNLRKIHKEARDQIRAGVIDQLEEHGINDKEDSLVDSIVDEITGNVRKKEIRNSFLSRLRMVTLFSMALIFPVVTILLSGFEGQYISKIDMKTSIGQAVENKASLNELKMVFSDKSKPSTHLIGPLINGGEYYRADEVTLQKVLEELKVDMLTLKAEEYTDKEGLKSLFDEVLREHLRVNPFEGLDDNDKRDLNNLSAKLSAENYSLIKSEIDGLTESLKVKNSLIREYLSSSNMSLYISLAAFIFSILIAVWQFLPNAKASQKQLISDAIREHVRELNSGNQKQAEV